MADDERIWFNDKYGTKAQFHSVEFFNSRIRQLFHERVRNSGKKWEEVVYSPDVEVTREDIQKIEDDLLATGFRYQFSAQISLVEDPEKYAATAGKGEVSEEDEMLAGQGAAMGETAYEEAGRLVVGTGQNVTRSKENVAGTIRFISSTDRVMEMVLDGVPDDTIAVIDDSGGTLTAPIIEGFKGILCLGGTVRSHLGILAREYGIPTLMDCKLSELHEGDRVEVEYTVTPPAATEAGLGEAERARVWKEGGTPEVGKPTYAQLLEANQYIRKNSDTFYFQCTTRTVQESKLFPVSPYIALSYYNCLYRYPSLFKKIEEVMPAEQIGDRMRESTFSLSHIAAGITTQFYLLGREELIALGLLKPTDAIEDILYVIDFWKRLMLSYKRNDAHVLNSDYGNRAEMLPERQLQVFEADAFGVTPGDRLHTALVRFLKLEVSQYCFLSHCECRLGIHNQGPYKVGDNEMILREFVDLAEGDYPWLDGVAANVPYNNLTIPVVMKDTHFDIVDDWASFEAKPSYDSDNIVAVGLYTSDYLSESYIPIGMNDRDQLADTFEQLRETLHEATNDLWKVIAGWSRDQLLEAGALVYYSVAKDIADIAGVYEQDDWFQLEDRVQRFKPLMNDDYGQLMLAELVGFISLPTQQVHPYTMAKWSNSSFHMQQGIPYSVLLDDEWTPSVGPMTPGTTALPAKTGLWQTTQGKFALDELNERCRNFTPKYAQEPWVYLDDYWVKYNHERPEADELYGYTQQNSRTIVGRGASLRRDDLGDLAKG